MKTTSDNVTDHALEDPKQRMSAIQRNIFVGGSQDTLHDVATVWLLYEGNTQILINNFFGLNIQFFSYCYKIVSCFGIGYQTPSRVKVVAFQTLRDCRSLWSKSECFL